MSIFLLVSLGTFTFVFHPIPTADTSPVTFLRLNVFPVAVVICLVPCRLGLCVHFVSQFGKNIFIIYYFVTWKVDFTWESDVLPPHHHISKPVVITETTDQLLNNHLPKRIISSSSWGSQDQGKWGHHVMTEIRKLWFSYIQVSIYGGDQRRRLIYRVRCSWQSINSIQFNFKQIYSPFLYRQI